MIKKTFIAISIFAVVFTSCNRLVSRLLGVGAPRVETIESIQSFCKKKGINTDDVFIIRTVDLAANFHDKLNEDFLFDRNGFLLKYNKGFSDSTCGGNILLTTKGIPPISYIERDSNSVFEDFKNTWMPLNDTLSSVNINCSNVDYTIVVYWNAFSGSPNHKKRINDIKKYIGLNSTSKIQLVLVNQDLRNINGEVIIVNNKRIN